VRLVKRLRKYRLRVLLMDWHISAAGPKRQPFLRSFTPRTASRLLLALVAWLRGKPTRPSAFRDLSIPSTQRVKVVALRRYARGYPPRVFIETGTHTGDTTAALAPMFQRCVTIELSEQLHAAAARRFSAMPSVSCLQGDSGRVISDVLRALEEPALFWLDAHHSGDATADAGYDPIFEELKAIFAHRVRTHVVLVDDARGHQVEAIRAMTPETHRFAVRNDIIRITPAV
jgi:hypothetical protein